MAVGTAGWFLGAAFKAIVERAVRVEEAVGVAALLALVGWLAWKRFRSRGPADEARRAPFGPKH
jgi:membrane protein DedA with SNARE-associated domain